MSFRKTRVLLFLSLVLTGHRIAALPFGPQSNIPSPCEGLKNLPLPDTTIFSSQIVPAGGFSAPAGAGGMRQGPGTPSASDLPSFCRVTGRVSPEVGFEVWLPPAAGDRPWNGKFNGVGNGGLAGFINYGAMIQALGRGYATASTDTGHTSKPGNEAWALGHPERLVDFASRGVHVTTVAAKALIEAYYGREPKYSYFTGCSGGGGQSLSEAQRFPDDYIGIVAGAPANFPTRMWPGELYAAWVTHRSPAHPIPNEKLPAITRAALEACDSMDGVRDGVLDDPRLCRFDPARIQCRDVDGPDCLTAAQVDSVRKIYAGLAHPATGELFWYGYEISSEPGWPGHIQNPFNVPLSYFKYMVLSEPDWDWKTFDFADPAKFAILQDASRKLGPVLDSIDPDLSSFRKRGGKLIQYHGWIDQNISPRNSIRYYEDVKKAMGGEKATSDFYRLYLAPGMAHCGGGPGPNTIDCLSALELWVEQGKAPERIIASHATAGATDRTRPLCPYPQVARYKGSGSTDDAGCFDCVAPPSQSPR